LSMELGRELSGERHHRAHTAWWQGRAGKMWVLTTSDCPKALAIGAAPTYAFCNERMQCSLA
jgi:hypothetical protein